MPSDTTQQILIALTLPLEISDDVCFLMLPVLHFKFIEWLGIAFVSSCLGLLLCTNYLSRHLTILITLPTWLVKMLLASGYHGPSPLHDWYVLTSQVLTLRLLIGTVSFDYNFSITHAGDRGISALSSQSDNLSMARGSIQLLCLG